MDNSSANQSPYDLHRRSVTTLMHRYPSWLEVRRTRLDSGIESQLFAKATPDPSGTLTPILRRHMPIMAPPSRIDHLTDPNLPTKLTEGQNRQLAGANLFTSFTGGCCVAVGRTLPANQSDR